MHRSIVIVSIATLALAAPLAAQGHSGKQTRTYVDARGRQCRETTHLKGNGDEDYSVKCKNAKGHKGRGHRDHDDDDDDGRYDVVQGRGYPATLPDMASAVIWGRGQRTSTATRWLGGNDYRVRYIDRDGDGRPEAASWFTSNGTMIQQWLDTNRDGRADAVKIFRDGRLVRQLGG